jgi:exopolysaccharide biosynthesis polyprenyl glycosylphosphotransferase
VLDFLAAALTVVAALAVGWDIDPNPVAGCIAAGAIWVLVLSVTRAGDRGVLCLSAAEYERVVRAGLWALLVVGLLVRDIDWRIAVALVTTCVTFTLAGRMGVRRWARHLVRVGRHERRLLAVGPVDAAVHLAEALARSPELGIAVVGLATDDVEAPATVSGWTVVGPAAAAPVLALEHGADVIALAPGSAGTDTLWGLLRSTTEEGDVALLVETAVPARAGSRTIALPSVRLLHVDEPPLRAVARLVKTCVDRIGALLLLVLLTPVLAATAVLVKLDSPGPVLFRQPRAGRGGRPFRIVKFRTMRVDAEELLAELRRRTGQDGAFFKLDDDPRITRIGRWLRRTSIDELPQLWNVVRGDMSLVGPRPLPLSEAGWFAPEDRQRTLVRPGITGLWQVSGRSLLSAEDAVRLDLSYIEHWSLAGDLAILLRTVGVVLRGSGAS